MSDPYSQPSFYRFNQDSFKLIQFVSNLALKPRSILDLGAGSGIIGLELALKFVPLSLTLVEIQDDFKEHLEKNVSTTGTRVNTEIVISSFGEFQTSHKFDLIVCNPPYYLPGHGESPVDPRRAIARSFLKDSWDILLRVIENSLSEEGHGFIVLKNNHTLFEHIQKEKKSSHLKLIRHEVGDLMILELIRLNVD